MVTSVNFNLSSFFRDQSLPGGGGGGGGGEERGGGGGGGGGVSKMRGRGSSP